MTFTYSSTSLSTDLAKVRLAIGDTSSATGAGIRPDGTNFSDEELAVFITGAASWRAAVAPILRVLANQYASAARSVRFADYAEDFTQTAAQLRKQADDADRNVTADGDAANGAIQVGTLTYSGLVYTVSDSGTVT